MATSTALQEGAQANLQLQLIAGRLQLHYGADLAANQMVHLYCSSVGADISAVENVNNWVSSEDRSCIQHRILHPRIVHSSSISLFGNVVGDFMSQMVKIGNRCCKRLHGKLDAHHQLDEPAQCVNGFSLLCLPSQMWPEITLQEIMNLSVVV